MRPAQGRDEKIEVKEIVKSDPNSFTVLDATKPIVPPKKTEAFTVAMTSKGPASEGKSFAAVVFGDSDFISNRGMLAGINRDLALNAFAQLTNQADLISIRPKLPKGNRTDAFWSTTLGDYSYWSKHSLAPIDHKRRDLVPQERGMKNLVLTVLVAALAGYTYYEYRQNLDQGSFADDERPPFTIKGDVIDYLAIERTEDPVELSKGEDGTWRMIKPVADEVDDASVLSALMTLTTQERALHAEGEEVAKDWTKYGLTPPAATFVLGAGKSRESLGLSSKNAFDGSFYLRKGDELLVGDSGFAQISARSSQSFRSRRLYRDDKPLQRIDVELEKEKYAVLKKDGVGSLEPAPSFAVATDKLESWVERVRDLKASEIVKDDPSEEDRRLFLLLVPSAKLKINNDFVLNVGQDRAQDVFLQTNRKSTVFKAVAQGLQSGSSALEVFFGMGAKLCVSG